MLCSTAQGQARAAAAEAQAAGLGSARWAGESRALAVAEPGAALLATVTRKFRNTHFRRFSNSQFWAFLLWTAKKNFKLLYMSLSSLDGLIPIIIRIRWGMPTCLG